MRVEVGAHVLGFAETRAVAHTQEKTQALRQPSQVQRGRSADRLADIAKITRKAF
jgi:hypothetical protein